MDKLELIQKLEDIEWEDFEVKEAKSEIPKNAWESVGAFSNTAGGWLIFGVTKKGKEYEILGVNNPEKIECDFLTTLRNGKFNRVLQVTSKKFVFGPKTVLAFYIPQMSGRDKPIYFNSKINTFIRTGSGDQRATDEEIDSMYRNSSFDKKDAELTKYTIKDLDKETISRYRTFLKNIDPEHRFNSLSTEKLLVKLRTIDKKKVIVGGLLMFGTEKTITRFMADFRIDYLEIKGTSYEDGQNRYNYRLPLQKNVFEYYFAIIEKLLKHIEIPFKLKGNFRDENQPQVVAIREALVNMLMHTDYFSNAKPRIRVFTDRIEFFNPGALPKNLKYILSQDFSLPRNSTMAHIFRTVQLSENIGAGFHKMINGWKSHYGTEPEIEGDFDYYKIVFRFGDGVKDRVKDGVKLSDNQQKILSLIFENKAITRQELAEKIGINVRNVDKNLNKLKERGLLSRSGSDKSGHWEIVDLNNRE